MSHLLSGGAIIVACWRKTHRSPNTDIQFNGTFIPNSPPQSYFNSPTYAPSRYIDVVTPEIITKFVLADAEANKVTCIVTQYCR
jgi:hypothetical protein